MLTIKYHDSSSESVIQYPSAADFVANQRLEVPDLEDYYRVIKADVDGQSIDLGTDATILGLYKKLSQK